MAASQPIGRQFGRFSIQQKIGTGGVATVYKAVDTTTNETVALKILHDTFSPESDMARRFVREAEISQRLQHPHIVSIQDSGTINGRTFLMMEYMKGGSLAQRFQQPARIATQATIKLLRQVASALDYAHGQGVIHRDMKLENILLGERGAALADFGIARVVGASKFTVTGNIVGTPLYMSPEQAKAKGNIDSRADVYSLSVLAYLLIVGCFPFSGEDVLAIIAQHIGAPPPVPSTLTPDITPAVDAVLLKGMAKKPDERYQSAGELIEALAAALQTAPLSQTLVDVHIVINQLMPETPAPGPSPLKTMVMDETENLSADEWYARAQETGDENAKILYLKRALKVQPMHSAANRALFRLEGAKPKEAAVPAPAVNAYDNQPDLEAIAPLPPLERGTRRAPGTQKKRGWSNILGVGGLAVLLVLCPMVTLRLIGVGTGLATGFKVITGGPTPIAAIDGTPLNEIPDAVYYVPEAEKLVYINGEVARFLDVLDGGYAHEYVFQLRRNQIIVIGVQFFSLGAGDVSSNVGVIDPSYYPADGRACVRSGTPMTFFGEDSGVMITCQADIAGEWSVRILGQDGRSNGLYLFTMGSGDLTDFGVR